MDLGVLDSSLQTAGAGVAPASVLTLVEGALNQMFFKKSAVIGFVLVPVGALLMAGFALAFAESGEKAERAAATEGPQTRRIRQGAVVPPAAILVKTYYVGELLGANVDRKRSQDSPGVNMTPLIDLIGSMIAPGTWRVLDESGDEIRTEGT